MAYGRLGVTLFAWCKSFSRCRCPAPKPQPTFYIVRGMLLHLFSSQHFMGYLRRMLNTQAPGFHFPENRRESVIPDEEPLEAVPEIIRNH